MVENIAVKNDVAIIIPFYNAGNYINDAVSSILNATGTFSYEIIIVDDGSTNAETLSVLDLLSGKKIKVLHQENKGPAAARNTGINNSDASYIFFLDADNRVKPGFISQSIELFLKHPDIDIIYGHPDFFGEIDTRKLFQASEYELEKIWFGNYIDMCAIMRKSVIDSIGLLDESPELIGHEDWEYWIRAGINNKRFYYIKNAAFDYRISGNSLITKATVAEKYESMFRYVYGKHYKYFQQMLQRRQYERMNPFSTFFKNFFKKYFGQSLKRLRVKVS